LPGDDELLLLVLAGFGSNPLMLLTNLAARSRHSESLWKIIETYLARWIIEETLRFLNQSYHLDDPRVPSYRRLQNLAVLVLAMARLKE
jgi:TorA maturation chaperone TorD